VHLLKLFRRLILRPLAADPVRLLLTLISIALGVAVVIAIELAGSAATGSFQSSLTTLIGKVDYRISANGGVDENVLAGLSALPVDAKFQPVIEEPIVIRGAGSVTMYGVDEIGAGLDDDNAYARDFSSADLETSVIVSNELASRLRWRVGDSLDLRGPAAEGRFRIRKVTADQNTSWVGVDIAAAQRLLGTYGRIDRIDVFAGRNENVDALGRTIRANVPAAYDMETPGEQKEENRRMLRAFRWNLRILSYISLVVGAFLIYNTIAVSVVRRRPEIGVLRALGTSSRGILLMFLGEALMLGLAGSIAGVLLGRVLASGLVGMLSRTVNALFTTSAPGEVTVSMLVVAAALGIGTFIAVVSALLPAVEASRVPPAEAMRRAQREYEVRLHASRNLTIAAALAAIAVVFCRFGPVGGRPLFGYLATFLSIAALALIAPAFIAFAIRILRIPLKRLGGAAGIVAGRSLVASLKRTSVIVTALATAIAMMVSVGIMVGSFRETVQVWLSDQLRADIYIRAQGPGRAGISAPIAPAVAGIVRATSGVDEADLFHAFTFRFQNQQATFGAGDMDILRRRRNLRFLNGAAGPILASLRNHDRCIVSEPFANKHHVSAGDVLRIPLGNVTAALQVAGVYYEYSSDRGFVLVDNSAVAKYLPDTAVTNIAIYVKAGWNAKNVQRALERRLADYPLVIAPNATLRTAAVEIFDRTFTITYALEAIAIIVSMLGAANSLFALVLDRRREIGLIRYLGAAGGQIRRMVLAEAGLIGLFASVLGLALGAALSLVLIRVVNKQSFGWTIQFHPPVLLLSGALLLVWIVTVIAGLYPARFAARLEPVDVIHEE
jgi:putative ABC transport system permease protein